MVERRLLAPTLLMVLLPGLLGAAARAAESKGELEAEIAKAIAEVGGGVKLDRLTSTFGGSSVEKYVLDNGLVLIFQADRSAPVFSIQTWVRVGSRHEEKGKTGMAHLFEHLMFRATSNREDGEYDRVFEALGCQTNADTWTDRTRYYEDLPREHLDIACELEADRLVNLVLDDATFADELDVVKNERRQSVENDPWGKLDETFTWTLFGREHPYGWPTLGWMEDLDAMTVEAAREFYRTYYAPNGVTLVIVGDLDRTKTLATVLRHYGKLAPSDLAESPDPEAPTAAAEHEREVELEFTSERVMTGWVTPPLTHPDHLPIELAVSILFDGDTSRWWRKIVRERPAAAEVSAFVIPWTAAGGVQLSATMLPAHQSSLALAAADEVIEEVRSGTRPITEAELIGARNRLEIQSLSSLATAHGKAEFLAESEVIMGDLDAGKARIERIQGVQIADLERVLSTYFKPERRATVVALPTAAAPDSSATETAPPAKQGDGVAPGPGGSLVMVEEDRSMPLVTVSIILRDGSAADPQGLAGLNVLAGDALALGAGGLTRTEISERFQAMGSSFAASTARESSSFSGTVRARDLALWMALAGKILMEPDFPKREVAKLKAETLANIEAIQEDDTQLARATFDAALFGANGYGHPVLGYPATIGAIDSDTLKAWHATLHGGDFIFSASGSVSLEEFTALVNQNFGDLPAGAVRPAGAADSSASLETGLNIVLVDKPDRTQARWILGTVAAGYQAGPDEAFDIANTAFGGTFKARLNDELRVKNAWTYGAFSRRAPARSLGTFTISSATISESTIPALKRTFEMLDLWLSAGLSEEEIVAARDYLKNSRPFQIDTAAARLNERVQRQLFDLSADYHSGILDRLAKVDAAAVNASLATINQTLSTRLLVIVGTATELESELRALPGVARMIVVPATHLGALEW